MQHGPYNHERTVDEPAHIRFTLEKKYKRVGCGQIEKKCTQQDRERHKDAAAGEYNHRMLYFFITFPKN